MPDLFNEALCLAQKMGYLGISLLQRKLNIGYVCASDLIKKIEIKGHIGARGSYEDSKHLHIFKASAAHERGEEGDV